MQGKKCQLGLFVLIPFLFSAHSRIIFPLDKYAQEISLYIDPTDIAYDKPLISNEYQKIKFEDFFDRYYQSDFDGKSPWCKNFVTKKLSEVFMNGVNGQNYYLKKLYDYKNQLDSTETKNEYNIFYGINYRPYSHAWYDTIHRNMNFDPNENFIFSEKNCAIAVDNALLRTLPTEDPCFFHDEIAGAGFPFDMLQQSAICIGNPVYIIKESLDHAWTLIVTTDCLGWVKSNSIARVSKSFIKKWQKFAKKNIIAVIKQSHLISEDGVYRAMAITGTTLPLKKIKNSQSIVLIPMKNLYGFAEIEFATLDESECVVMPYLFTPHHLANVLKNQIGKPYGWGNSYFYFDCSAELKAIFSIFGIYLPRNSAVQADAGTKVDILDDLSTSDREKFLLENGKKFVTIIYIPGHVALYIGKFENPNSEKKEFIAMTYQNIWGLKTCENNSRYIIGQSVIFPILSKYSENEKIISLHDSDQRKKFRLVYLDNPALVNNYV